jgi:hypothetical protein
MSAMLRSSILAAGLVVAVAACGWLAELSDPAETVLQVENQTTLDLNIYVVPDTGGRERLGTANEARR